MRLPLPSKIIMMLGGGVIFFPSLVFLGLHHFFPAVPQHVSFMSRMLMSAVGIGIVLAGAVSALVAEYLSE